MHKALSSLLLVNPLFYITKGLLLYHAAYSPTVYLNYTEIMATMADSLLVFTVIASNNPSNGALENLSMLPFKTRFQQTRGTEPPGFRFQQTRGAEPPGVQSLV